MRPKAWGPGFALIVASLGAVGCGPPPVAPTPVMRAIDETRTLALMREAVREAGFRVSAPREHVLAEQKKLREDVRIGDSIYGIAFVTDSEVDKLGSAIPAYRPDSDQLRLVRPVASATGESGAVVLVLYAKAYRYDVGHTHASNVTTAENKLKRDVSDFVHHVVKTGKHR
jgi:hypothetical protein